MRQAAYLRHIWLWMLVDGGDIDKWEKHEKMIKGFYGY